MPQPKKPVAYKAYRSAPMLSLCSKAHLNAVKTILSDLIKQLRARGDLFNIALLRAIWGV